MKCQCYSLTAVRSNASELECHTSAAARRTPYVACSPPRHLCPPSVLESYALCRATGPVRLGWPSSSDRYRDVKPTIPFSVRHSWANAHHYPLTATPDALRPPHHNRERPRVALANPLQPAPTQIRCSPHAEITPIHVGRCASLPKKASTLAPQPPEGNSTTLARCLLPCCTPQYYAPALNPHRAFPCILTRRTQRPAALPARALTHSPRPLH